MNEINLRQLDRDSILTLYVADELGHDDRAAVERMLAGDAEMRAELEALRQAWSAADADFVAADERLALPVASQSAERRVSRMLRQWHAESLALGPAKDEGKTGRKFPWWAYPTAAAACLALGALVWWENQPIRSDAANSVATTQSDSGTVEAPGNDEVVADMLERSFTHPSRERIVDAEREVVALSNVPGNGAVLDDNGSDGSAGQDIQ